MTSARREELAKAVKELVDKLPVNGTLDEQIIEINKIVKNKEEGVFAGILLIMNKKNQKFVEENKAPKRYFKQLLSIVNVREVLAGQSAAGLNNELRKLALETDVKIEHESTTYVESGYALISITVSMDNH